MIRGRLARPTPSSRSRSCTVICRFCLCVARRRAGGARRMPTRKAGLWEMKMTSRAATCRARRMQHCTDAATDKLMTSNSATPVRSEVLQARIQGVRQHDHGRFGLHDERQTMTTHAVVSGDFNSAYTVKVTSKREGGPAGAAGAGRETNMTVEAKWLGACKADQKPGDMVLPGGQKVNIVDMQRLQCRPVGARHRARARRSRSEGKRAHCHLCIPCAAQLHMCPVREWCAADTGPPRLQSRIRSSGRSRISSAPRSAMRPGSDRRIFQALRAALHPGHSAGDGCKGRIQPQLTSWRARTSRTASTSLSSATANCGGTARAPFLVGGDRGGGLGAFDQVLDLHLAFAPSRRRPG